MKAIYPIVALALALPYAAHAQSAAQAPRKPAARPNVQSGTIAALDAAAGTLTLHPRTGADVPYRITDNTRCVRQKRPAACDAFHTGDEVVVRFRKSRVGPPTLYDLADRPSWEWLDHVRRDTVQVTIRKVEEGFLQATEGADAAPIEYRVTEKTRWARSGAPAAPTAFKEGDRAWVTPRLLPGGATMAIAVADTPEMAGRLKERSRSVVTGVLKAVDAQKRTLALRTVAGDDRDLPFAADCLVRQSAKDVPLTAMRPGQTVTVHLTRDVAGDQVVTRVTIQAKKPAARKP